MADYDDAEVTTREKKAAKNQVAISKANVSATKKQLKNQLANYDFSDAQNRALADTERQQNSRATSADRFEAQRDLQNSALALLGSIGSAMNGSTTQNLMHMLEDRNDKENNTYWQQLQENQDTVENTYNDSFNQNNNARRDAITSAIKAVQDSEADLAANLNNINPSLFKTPGKGSTNLGSKSLQKQLDKIKKNNSEISGYVMPDNRSAGTRNTYSGSSNYFNQLVNRNNGV